MALGLTSPSTARADEVPTENPLSPPDPAALKRWQDERFGMFIHWGPIAQKGEEISWTRGGRRVDRDGQGNIPIEVYDNLYKTFDPEKFDAKEWVRIAQSAGMKYIVLVAKHHDGFCMYDSKLTDYKITNSPFRRDICAELARACHAAGISFGIYYSPPDWHQPDYIKDQSKYIQYMKGQVRELLTNYGKVDVLWFDNNGGPNKPSTWDNAALFPMIRELQPQILLTKRCGGWGDFNTPEQRVGGFDAKNAWESCMTISSRGQWAWGGDGDGVKPLSTVVKMLASCAGGDGNMLLNVGPRPDGRIDPQQAARLAEMGAWLQKNGQSIYNTRGGPYKPGPRLASTYRGSNVYLHVLSWKGESLVLPPLGRKVVRSELLAGGSVKVQQNDQGLAVTVPPADRQPNDTVIKLELDGSAEGIAPIEITSGSIARNKAAKASNVYHNDWGLTPNKAFDDDPDTRWATDDGTTAAWLEVDLGKPMPVGRVEIEEAYPGRVQSFELQYKDGDSYKTFYSGTTLGANFATAKFPPITAQHIRLNILKATQAPTVSEFQIFSKP